MPPVGWAASSLTVRHTTVSGCTDRSWTLAAWYLQGDHRFEKGGMMESFERSASSVRGAAGVQCMGKMAAPPPRGGFSDKVTQLHSGDFHPEGLFPSEISNPLF